MTGMLGDINNGSQWVRYGEGLQICEREAVIIEDITVEVSAPAHYAEGY